jgi:hypothetical protein
MPDGVTVEDEVAFNYEVTAKVTTDKNFEKYI